MITHLASPSVCVIDDEKEDYEPILNALLRMGLGCVHVKGDSETSLPRKPFAGLRVVFTDLHLASHTGKAAASHTAKVFSRVVSTDTAPLIVVIWSKYRDDVPAEDGVTESELFKTTLIDSFPKFHERLVFLDMNKPKLTDRPGAKRWVRELEREIGNKLESVSAFDAIWAWESSVRDAGKQVTEGLTTLALLHDSSPANGGATTSSLPEKLKLALRLLVREQGGSMCSPNSAPGHLCSVLGQSLVDHLEHMDGRNALARHGTWLSDQSGLPKSSAIGPGVNGFLLTASVGDKPSRFVPGTVYEITAQDKFQSLFGVTSGALIEDCYGGPPKNFDAWKTTYVPKPVLIELSPVCDVQHGTRRSAFLIGGLAFPDGARKCVKRAEAIEMLPTFLLRWPAKDFQRQHVLLVFFSRLKITMRPSKEPKWLRPWFRLRELPTASLRNWHSGHAARVGYVSLLCNRG